MKIFLLLIFLTACQDFNSNTSDRDKFGPSTLPGASSEFNQAYKITQNRCVNCHTSTIHNVWATYITEAAWIDSGLITPGNADNSLFIERIINSGHSNSNMPEGGSALPNAEYNDLKTWINGL
jgi:uncharacterized membrane protein